MRIINMRRIVDNGRTKTRTKPIEGIAIHRTGVDTRTGVILGWDPQTILDHFKGENPRYPEVAAAVGRRIPYQFMVGGGGCNDGTVWQCLGAKNEWGPHARGWSEKLISIAAIGDFRSGAMAPTPCQWTATADLVAVLASAFRLDPEAVYGHDELPGGSSNPAKQCPGDQWDMREFRKYVAGSMQCLSETHLIELGLEL